MYILRGLPGSGKSTLAQQIGGTILSTDDFFIDATTGQYNFNSKSLPKAHYWNQLRAQFAIESFESPIIIDNTNLKAWEAQPYVSLAKEHGYQVTLLPMPEFSLEDLAKRNKHGLTLEDLQVMAGKVEDFTVTDAIKAVPPVVLNVKDMNKVKMMFSNKEVEVVSQSSSLR